MNVLIILEQKQYKSLSKKLCVNPQIHVEVTNVDFDLKMSITKAQVVIFFGEESTYVEFTQQYQNLLKSKLIIKNCKTSYQPSKLEVDMYINSGVGVCAIPSVDESIRIVIIETVHTIFDNNLKIISTTIDDFERVVKTIKCFENDLGNLCTSAEDTFGIPVALHILKNFELR